MNKFEIFNETKYEIDIKEEEEFIKYALNYKKLKNITFNIIFIDNKTIKKINKKYRNIDRETDVISFALEDTKDIIVNKERILGDIYISVEKMKKQAKEYGHSETREMCFLTIHGLLHLLGYDHQTKQEEEEMFNEQELILNGYGITR